jgi:RNA polymerase sigma factor (sigma-70 family)
MNRMLKGNNQPEDELWMALAAGNEYALEALFKKHHAIMYRLGMKWSNDRDLVLDSIQDLFESLWQNRNKLAKVKWVKAYMLKMFRRILIRKIKKNRKTITQPITDTLWLPEFTEEDFIISAETKTDLARIVSKALNELSERERQVLYMRFYLEMEYDEIAQYLNLNYQVIMNYTSRAFRKLRENPVITKDMIAQCLGLIGFMEIYLSNHG